MGLTSRRTHMLQYCVFVCVSVRVCCMNSDQCLEATSPLSDFERSVLGNLHYSLNTVIIRLASRCIQVTTQCVCLTLNTSCLEILVFTSLKGQVTQNNFIYFFKACF